MADLDEERAEADTEEVPRLFVHRRAADDLLRLPRAPWELGGWLLGYWAAQGSQIVVTHPTPPGPKGTRFGVRISSRGHRERFDAAWDASEGEVTYLGDWHTHPGGPPEPSEQDAATLGELAEKEHFHTPRPLMAIVQNPRWPWSTTKRVVAFYMRGFDRKLYALTPKLFEGLAPRALDVPRWKWPRHRSCKRRVDAGLYS
jgi:integrative and conjugative element protein (TIGR02256 family)